MGKKKWKNFSLLSIAMLLLVLERQWGWFFGPQTIYSNKLLSHFITIVIFLLFGILLYRNSSSRYSGFNLAWVPWIILAIIGDVLSFKIVGALPYFSYLVLILVSSKTNILDALPAKFIFWSGFIAMVGVYVQFFYQPFYNAYINGIFNKEYMFHEGEFLTVEDAMGMNGFTYQQGNTSTLIVYGLMVMLFLKEETIPRFLQKKYIYWPLVVVMVVAIFFTGKRTMSVLAVIIPLIIYYFSSQSGGNRFVTALAIGTFAMLVYYIILPVLLESYDMFFFRRLQESMEGSRYGEDVTSGRIDLWNAAIRAWKEHPIFGIGMGKFMEYTHSHTDAHNTYLQVLCEQGLVGFIPYVIAVVYTLIVTIRLLNRATDRKIRSYLKVSLAFQLVFIFYAFTGNVNIDSSITLYIIGAAITIRVNTLMKKEKKILYDNSIKFYRRS